MSALGMIVVVAAGLLADAKETAYPFTRADLGKLPAGWLSAQTGEGTGSVWKVVADATAPGGTGYALAQIAVGPEKLFNLCVVEKARARDVVIRVTFKAVAGVKDQGGGIVWRYQDADNYYLARMNPLEDNYRFYKVVAGKRTQLATKEGVKAPADEWHRLEVRHTGEHVECLLNGQQLLEANDATFRAAGRVGLWSKSDAQTYFDGFWVRGD